MRLNGPTFAVTVCALVCATHIAEAQSFEGAITLRLASGGRNGGPATQDVEYLSRNGNVRVNVASPMGAVAILGLVSEAKTYVVIEAQKSYMDVSAPDPGSTGAAPSPEPKSTRSGKKEMVAGYECEHVFVETSSAAGAGRTDVCVTQALGTYVDPTSAFGRATPSMWQRVIASAHGFPLKVTMADGSVVLEVTKVEKRRVSDVLFRIPADFNKVDMPKRP